MMTDEKYKEFHIKFQEILKTRHPSTLNYELFYTLSKEEFKTLFGGKQLMQEYIQEITKYACAICAEEFSSRKDIEWHLKCASEYNDGSIKEKIPDEFKIGTFVKVKHRWKKTYTMAKIVSFSHDSMLHQLIIYLDRYCYNRDSDCFPQYDTHCQCSTLEILSEDDLSEYTLEQVEP